MWNGNFLAKCIYKYLRTTLCPQICKWSIPPPLWTGDSAASLTPRQELYLFDRGPWAEEDCEGVCTESAHPSPCEHRYHSCSNTYYCILLALQQFRGPGPGPLISGWPQISLFSWIVVQDHKVLSLQEWTSFPFNRRCAHMVRALFHTGSISWVSSTTLSSSDGMKWDWAIFQQGDLKKSIISPRASHWRSFADYWSSQFSYVRH